MTATTVDDYIAGLRPDQAALVRTLRALLAHEAPHATQAIKWAQPVFAHQGPLAYVKAFKSYVTLGFWRGAELTDPDARLEGDGALMRHVKVRTAADIRPEQFAAWIREAVQLNASKGDPTKRR